MANSDLDPTWAEFKRLGISPRTFTKLVSAGEATSKTAPANFAMTIGPETWALMKSLPDGAGEEAFINAFRAKFPQFGTGGSAGA
jgi:hypothetical protein